MVKKYLIMFLISMVPIVELRGAIPYAAVFGIPTLRALIICMLGNILPVPVIFWFARRVLMWGKDKKYIGKFFTWCIQKGEKGGQKLLEKTGAWTGTLAASFLDLDWKKSALAVMGGVVLAGLIVGVVSYGLLGAIAALF